MITRIVKLSVRPEHFETFRHIYHQNSSKIRSFPGCHNVVLLENKDQNLFFTFSHWSSSHDLEAYRSSETFTKIWRQVKPLFLQKAEAWTLIESQTNSEL